MERFTKTKEERTGARGKGGNFVFATLSPPKEKEEGDEEEKKGRSGAKAKGPPAKRQKLNRNLDENSRKGTIFNLL